MKKTLFFSMKIIARELKSMHKRCKIKSLMIVQSMQMLS